MAGRVLIYDGIASNRIILRCKLSAACYQILQASSYADLRLQAMRETPDIVLLDLDEDAEAALAVCRALTRAGETVAPQVICLASDGTAALRIAAFRAGAAAVLAKPCHEALLMASLRRSLREVQMLGTALAGTVEFDLSEDPGLAAPAGRIGVVSADRSLPRSWLARLRQAGLPHGCVLLSPEQALNQKDEAEAPDVYILAADLRHPHDGLRLLSEIKSRAATQNARAILVLDGAEAGPAQTHLIDAAMAFDLGADDVLVNGFHEEELALRIEASLRQKRRADQYRRSLRAGMHLATIDPLTGLYNRRYAMPRLDRLLRAARATRQPLAVLALDLDRFKGINDSLGHAAGDSVLVEVARRLGEAVRPRDLVARSGGEEFWIALPDTDAARAQQIAQALRQRVRSNPVPLPDRGAPVRVTISIGIAVADPQDSGAETLDALLQRADRALYAAKADGRDQVNCAGHAA